MGPQFLKRSQNGEQCHVKKKYSSKEYRKQQKKKMDVSVLISNRQKYETTKYDYNKIARRLMTAKKTSHVEENW